MLQKILKWSSIGIGLTLVVIQFIRPEKNVNPVVSGNDITQAYGVPDSVAQVLHKACYDCHSNNTAYPWYNNIQPVAWWLADHVNEGKRELNFSEFGTFKTKRKLKKMREIVKEVEEGEMPMDSYTWIHKEAVLTPAEKQMLIDWAKGLEQRITLQEGGNIK